MTKITRLKLMSTAHANTIAKPSPCCDAQDAWSNEGAMHVPLQEDRAHARTSAAAPSRQAEVGQVIVLAPVEPDIRQPHPGRACVYLYLLIWPMWQ